MRSPHPSPPPRPEGSTLGVLAGEGAHPKGTSFGARQRGEGGTLTLAAAQFVGGVSAGGITMTVVFSPGLPVAPW